MFNKIIPTIGFLILVFTFSAGCRQSNDLPPGCSGEDILLDGSEFPSGATVGNVLSPVPEGTNNSAGVTIHFSRGFLVQQVIPFSSSHRAELEYQENLKDPVFSEQGEEKAWAIPDELEMININADNFRLACGEQHSIPMCRTILQHDQYYVFVNAHMHEEDLSFIDFIHIINEIDARIQNCLE
ncbi:MAG: hypothetical protein KJ069_05995 [Anaerolineae bacterium]|nr:hypothetical protein [Anaerolineae bacterium]